MDDDWSFTDVLSLLEGGNTKFREFCAQTNAYPNLQSDVDNRKQFIDGLYASVPVKAYRSLLRKAVAKVKTEREGLIKSFFQKQQQNLRRQTEQQPFWDDHMSDPTYKQTYITVMPTLSIYEFCTKVMDTNWPLIHTEVEEAERSVYSDTENTFPTKHIDPGDDAYCQDNLQAHQEFNSRSLNIELQEEKKDVDNDLDKSDYPAIPLGTQMDTTEICQAGASGAGIQPMSTCSLALDSKTVLGLELDEMGPSENLEYMLPLKHDDLKGSQAKSRMFRKSLYSAGGLCAVPETGPSADWDKSLLGENPGIVPARATARDDDDARSVVSSVSVGSRSVGSFSNGGSSVGSLDLKDIPLRYASCTFSGHQFFL